MSGTVVVEWQGRQVEAARPDPVAGLRPTLSDRTARRTEQAAAAVQRVGDRGAGVLEVAARLLLRAEGLASSAIEGIRASAEDVALAEATASAPATLSASASAAASASGRADPSAAPDAAGSNPVAAWVADNLAVVTEALADDRPLDQSLLLAWHTRLMRHSPYIEDRHVGAYRDVLGWIGGPNPLVAAHVAVPAPDIPRLMDDLFAFLARDDIDAVTQAAVAHAQFETIHPFADGNGRLGRVIIARTLSRRLGVAVPPPVSPHLARDVGGYLSGLTLFRQGYVDQWVSWFADVVETSARASGDALAAVAELQAQWRRQTADLRADAAARRLVEVLPAYPVVDARTVAKLLDVSEQAARIALEELRTRGLVMEIFNPARVPGRPRRWWAAHTLLDLLR